MLGIEGEVPEEIWDTQGVIFGRDNPMIWLSKFYRTIQRTRNFQAHPVLHLYKQNLFRPDAVLLSKFIIGKN